MTLIKERIPALDGLRGLAILLVMFHHFTVIEAPHSFWGNWLIKTIHLGGTGVDLFFVLSGFLITGILLDSKENLNYFKNFYIRRILRIFPLYYLFITLSLFIMPEVLQHFPKTASSMSDYFTARNHWPWYYFYLSNFWVAIKGFFGSGGIDITWSLAIEEHFYLVWPFFIYFIRREMVSFYCLIIIAGTLTLKAVLQMIGLTDLQVYVLTFTRLDGLALGGFIAAFIRMPPTSSIAKQILGSQKFLLLSFLILLCSASSLQFPSFLITLFYGYLLTFCLYAKDSFLVKKILRHPLLVFWGNYSYSLYLMHIPIAAALRQLLPASEAMPGGIYAWQFLFYAIALMAVIPPALFSWFVIEKPALSLKRYFPLT